MRLLLSHPFDSHLHSTDAVKRGQPNLRRHVNPQTFPNRLSLLIDSTHCILHSRRRVQRHRKVRRVSASFNAHHALTLIRRWTFLSLPSAVHLVVETKTMSETVDKVKR